MCLFAGTLVDVIAAISLKEIKVSSLTADGSAKMPIITTMVAIFVLTLIQCSVLFKAVENFIFMWYNTIIEESSRYGYGHNSPDERDIGNGEACNLKRLRASFALYKESGIAQSYNK